MPRPVLHVAPFLWSGAGSVITRLCESQRQQRDVVLVTGGYQAGFGDWPTYRRRLRTAGVAHHSIDFFHRESGTFWSSAAQLAALISDVKPAVIHAHAGVPAAGAVVARAISRVRPILVAQMYSWGLERPAWMDRQDLWGLSQSDCVVCSARAYFDLLARAGVPRRNLIYLPWGLPLDELPWCGDSIGARATARAENPVLGFVGRIEPRKGQLALVEAFARLRLHLPSARLILAGPAADDTYVGQIRAQIHRHRLDGTVVLAGRVRDVTRHLRTWDLFVSLSSDEGQGLAVQEAMAIGVPVLARSVAGISDFLTHGRTGLTLPDASAARVARLISQAWTQPRVLRSIARRARQLIERRYSWDRTVRAFARLYERR